MANLVLTTSCNRRPLLLRRRRDGGAGPQSMNLRDSFIRRYDRAANRPRVGLLGGEPTLHPIHHHPRLPPRPRPARCGLTNGLCGDDLIRRIDAIPDPTLLTFLVNVNAPEDARATRWIARSPSFAASRPGRHRITSIAPRSTAVPARCPRPFRPARPPHPRRPRPAHRRPANAFLSLDGTLEPTSASSDWPRRSCPAA